jgi:hypothetical protein
MNRAIDPAAAAECRVRRVYDGIHLTRGNVATHDLNSLLVSLHKLHF